jgi:hypothetical protein
MAVGAAVDGWTAIMTGIWSAGLWLLKLAFHLVDAFTTPDLSADGPLRPVLPTTLWLGGFVAVVMLFVQLGAALVRRDGKSVGRVLLGVAQYGFVVLSLLGVAAGAVVAAAGLEHGILSATLGVGSLSDPAAVSKMTASWPRQLTEAGAATVLGITSLLLIIPGAFADVLVALVRDAALIVLVATAPISAAGLVSDVGKAWFWKTLRWFVSAVLIAPLSALVLGIGVGVSKGVLSGAGDSTTVAIGTAVVGAVLIMVAAISPLVLFRLLAFVDPSTVSGAAMRQAWADAGGVGGLFGRARGAGGGVGSGAATAEDGTGRSQGEATAQAATASRMSSALGVVGQGVQWTAAIANRAVDLGTDVLGSAGVGHPGYSMTPADERALRTSRNRRSSAGPASPPGASPPGTTPPTGPAGKPTGPGGGAGGGSTGAGAAGAGVDLSSAEAGLMIA